MIAHLSQPLLAAALVAGPILRLQSHYFALATLALASLVNSRGRQRREPDRRSQRAGGFRLGRRARASCLMALVWIVPDRVRPGLRTALRGPPGRDRPPAARSAARRRHARHRWRALAVRGLRDRRRRWRASPAPARRRLSGVVSPEATGFLGDAALPDLGGAGRRAPSDGRGAGRRSRRLPARAVPRPAGRLAAGLCRGDAGRRAVGAARPGRPDRPAAGVCRRQSLPRALASRCDGRAATWCSIA